jgi:hypothetical protein
MPSAGYSAWQEADCPEQIKRGKQEAAISCSVPYIHATGRKQSWFYEKEKKKDEKEPLRIQIRCG